MTTKSLIRRSSTFLSPPGVQTWVPLRKQQAAPKHMLCTPKIFKHYTTVVQILEPRKQIPGAVAKSKQVRRRDPTPALELNENIGEFPTCWHRGRLQRRHLWERFPSSSSIIGEPYVIGRETAEGGDSKGSGAAPRRNSAKASVRSTSLVELVDIIRRLGILWR